MTTLKVLLHVPPSLPCCAGNSTCCAQAERVVNGTVVANAVNITDPDSRVRLRLCKNNFTIQHIPRPVTLLTCSHTAREQAPATRLEL